MTPKLKRPVVSFQNSNLPRSYELSKKVTYDGASNATSPVLLNYKEVLHIPNVWVSGDYRHPLDECKSRQFRVGLE